MEATHAAWRHPETMKMIDFIPSEESQRDSETAFRIPHFLESMDM
jgi:hypothetical protein